MQPKPKNGRLIFFLFCLVTMVLLLGVFGSASAGDLAQPAVPNPSLYPEPDPDWSYYPIFLPVVQNFGSLLELMENWRP